MLPPKTACVANRAATKQSTCPSIFPFFVFGGKELVTEMMTTLSQTVSVFSNKAINLKSVASFNTIKTLRFNPPSSPRSLSRLVFKRLSLINFFELNLSVSLFSVTLFQEVLSSSSHNFARRRGESGG